MQRDESDPPVSAYTSDDAPVRASVSAPIGPAKTSTGAVSSPPQRIVRDWSGRAIAIISLVVALASLAYNTWRNESTESHRNIRQACFIILEESAALQQIVEIRFYGGDRSKSTWIAAWGKASLIRDIGTLAPPRTGQEAQNVFYVWSKRSQGIDARDPLAEDEMSDAIERLRRQTLDDLRKLD